MEKTTTEEKPTIYYRTKKSKQQVEDCRPRTFAIWQDLEMNHITNIKTRH